MKYSKIIITGCQKNFGNLKDTRIIPIKELASWIKSAHILKHLFRYKESKLYTYRLELFIQPFYVSMAVFMLSRGTCFIEDAKGTALKVTLGFLLKRFIRYLADYFRSPSYLNQIRKAITSQNPSDAAPNLGKILSLDTPPLYLRSDDSFGLIAGGSLGHTLGVLENFQHFLPPPVFLTTVNIPGADQNIQIHEIIPPDRYRDFREVRLLFYNESFLKSSEKLLKSNKFSFIYQRYFLHNFSGQQLAEKYRIPFVLEYNGSEIWVSRNWGSTLKYETLGEQIELLNLKSADVVVVVSKPLEDELIRRGIEKNKILVNPNGVDPDLYSPTIDGSLIREKYNLNDKTVLGFIGTFGQWHGAEVLAEAFGLLMEKYPIYRDTVKLLMIGDGITFPKVKETLHRYEVMEITELTGLVPQDEGAAHLAACDVLVSPHVPNSDGTPFFGSPTKLFEYMAMGKAIAASDLEQIGEILQHEQTALLAPPGNPQALMEGMKTLIDHPDLRSRLGQAARQEVVARYTWKEHTRKIIEKLKQRCG